MYGDKLENVLTSKKPLTLIILKNYGEKLLKDTNVAT